MKSIFLLLLTFILTSYSSAQKISEIVLNDSLKTRYLFKTFHYDNYCVFPRYDDGDTVRSFIETHDQSFQFYLSNSNDTLLIFDGKLCGGHESGVVNIYNFKNGEPEPILSRPGKIAGSQNDTIWVYSYPCCSQVLNIIVPFSIQTGEKLGNAHLFYSREDFTTVFPVKEKVNQKYELAKESEIHWSPFETDQSHAPVCNSYENIIGKVSEGTSFTLIEISSNDWVLIRLDNMLTSEGYCIDEYRQKLIGGDKYALYGWIPISHVKWRK